MNEVSSLSQVTRERIGESGGHSPNISYRTQVLPKSFLTELLQEANVHVRSLESELKKFRGELYESHAVVNAWDMELVKKDFELC